MHYSPDRSFGSPQKVDGGDKATQKATLSELDQTIKDAQQRLNQKKREFDFIAKLDKKQVSKYILGADPETLPHIITQDYSKTLEERYSPKKFGKENEPKTSNWMTLPDRKANLVDLNKYMEKVKDNFYEPIPKERIKVLHEQLRKARDKYSLANIRDDDEKLAEKYHTTYSGVLKDQLKQEVERRRRNKYLTEMHEMRMILSQKVNINEPKIWKKEPIDASEARRVREVFEEKMNAHHDKSLQFSIDYETDITKKIEAYLNSKYKDINLDREIPAIVKEYDNLHPIKAGKLKESLQLNDPKGKVFSSSPTKK